jgi:hypothetical protein
MGRRSELALNSDPVTWVVYGLILAVVLYRASK